MDLQFLSAVDEKDALLKETSDFIFDHPETAFTEFASAACLCDALRQEGFTVTENLAGIKTAFSGRFGSGRPVIGILGEFDALSGLGQVAGVTEQMADGKPNGHGCGHHLLGTGSLGAAIAVKRYLETAGRSGTVIYFGCPGEEGGSGKAFMARDGVFDELDAAVSWHPYDLTQVRTKTSLANVQVLYKFDGVAAHAGAKPHMGRSALDAVELMNVGVNFLREHVVQEARMHYAITDAGGFSPNVVQPHAEVLYLLRAPKGTQVQDIFERVNMIAQGAALMTQTKMQYDFIKGCSDTVLNNAMQMRLYEVMQQIETPKMTEEEIAYARELTEKSMMSFPDIDLKHPINSELSVYHDGDVELANASTDVGDVSYICPTAQLHAATFVRGTPGHTWQATAVGKSSQAHKMMLYAAKAMAGLAVELIRDDALLAAAKAEHRERVGKDGYRCPIPAGVKPRAMSSFVKNA